MVISARRQKSGRVRSAILGLIAFSLLVACGGGLGSLGTPCASDATCTDSFCDGSLDEESRCKEASDCPGYVNVNYGARPLGPNKKCINGRCRQVGRCSNNHS